MPAIFCPPSTGDFAGNSIPDPAETHFLICQEGSLQSTGSNVFGVVDINKSSGIPV